VNDYYAGCNELLLRAVPLTARRILDVGCGEGRLGAALRRLAPGRQVFGIEREPAIAMRATPHLDEVFTLDAQVDDPPLEPESLDCILFGDVLEHLIAPTDVLARYRRFLRADGIVLCSIPNIQHHSVIAALLKGDFQYTPAGLLDIAHVRFFTYSTILKMLLDAGFAPHIVDTIATPSPPPFLRAAAPLLQHLGVDPHRTQRYLAAYQYIVKGDPLPPIPADDAPLSFVVCVSDEASLANNFLSSPCLGANGPHEILLVRECRSAAEGLNRGVARARHDVVVCVHQDVYLPRDWPARFWQGYRAAQHRFGALGPVGVYGVRGDTRVGHVVDRDRLLREPESLPARVDTLDELLLAVPRDVAPPFEPRLGFHFYGADICLAARDRGLSAVVIDALCFHNSPHTALPPDFFVSGHAFAAKWRGRLPVATSCARIEADGTLRAN
jgi:SAM-dependent methyltransferase